jgi:hypothetical protein
VFYIGGLKIKFASKSFGRHCSYNGEAATKLFLIILNGCLDMSRKMRGKIYIYFWIILSFMIMKTNITARFAPK